MEENTGTDSSIVATFNASTQSTLNYSRTIEVPEDKYDDEL